MSRHNLSEVARYLRQLTRSADTSGTGDAELLERYIRCRDEAAFELLVWRHAALVFNVCRRILPCPQDAEDAFQATFLAFVRKAGSIHRRGSVASWLYKVAYRVALEARERTRKAAVVEKTGVEMLAVQPANDPLWSDVRPILDEELNRLPERLRRPIVLCYLEGKSNAEAAQVLGCRLGTIYSRLSRGREMLRQRLQRRGVSLPVAAVTAALTARAADAAPAICLMRAAARLALAYADASATPAVSPRVTTLAEGVLRTMFVSKLKIVAVMLLVIGVATSGVLTQARTAALPQGEAKAEDPPQKPAGVDEKNAKPITVKVVKPKRGGLPDTFTTITASLNPSQKQHLFPLVSGTIGQVAVDIGDPVKKGQVLIVLDSPLTAKDVEEKTAALEMAQARMEEAKAKIIEERGPGVANRLDRAVPSLRAAHASVKLAHVALEKARIQEGFTQLHAEFDGVVSERNCDPGNFVQGGAGGTGKPLLTLVRVDRLRVVVELPGVFAGMAENGDPVVLSEEGVNYANAAASPEPTANALRGDPKNFITGKVERISPVVDRPGGMRTAIIGVANPNNRLVAGNSIAAHITFNKTRQPDAFTVPRSCVIPVGDKALVYIVRDGKARRTLIKRGKVLGDVCEVIEGIKVTDLLISNLDPTHPPSVISSIGDGIPVKIEKGP